jgi:PST family polysaccharide transporter
MERLRDVWTKPLFRQAAINFGWISFERAARVVLNALIGLMVARHLGPARLGLLSYCTALVALLAFVPALGLDAIVKRELLRGPEKASELLASSFMLRLIAGTVGYALVLLAGVPAWGLADDEARLLAVIGLMLFQPAFFLSDLWLQAHLRAQLTTAVQLGALCLSSALRLWLIHVDGPIVAFAWANIVESVLVAVGCFVGARCAGLRFPIAAARLKIGRQLLNDGWPLMFASLAIVVYMKIDEIMLRQLSGVEAVGVYAAAAKLSEIWYFIPIGLASSLLPALLRARDLDATLYGVRLQQYYDVSAFAAYLLSVPIAFAASWIVRVAYGDAFTAAGPILGVHIWSSIFVFLGVARGQWLVNEGLQKFYLGATIVGAVANVLLNLLLIPRWDGLGAAYATLASYAIAAWLASYFHPAVRATAAMQTRALLIPFRGWRYLRRT